MENENIEDLLQVAPKRKTLPEFFWSATKQALFYRLDDRPGLSSFYVQDAADVLWQMNEYI